MERMVASCVSGCDGCTLLHPVQELQEEVTLPERWGGDAPEHLHVEIWEPMTTNLTRLPAAPIPLRAVPPADPIGRVVVEEPRLLP
jgi:hypothetical protein